MGKENIQRIKTTEQILWVDTAKGIGVFLVIIGHLWYGSNLPGINHVIYSFHMPMFFVLSGFLVTNHVRGNLLNFIGKKFRRLVLPAALCVLLGLPYYVFVVGEILDWEIFLKGFFFIEGLALFNAPCWFFLVLFQVTVIERILNVSSKNIALKTALCVAFFFVGMIIYNYESNHEIAVCFGLDKTVISLGFFITGIILREAYDKWKNRIQRDTLMYFVLLLSSAIPWLFFGIIINPKITMYRMILESYPCFVISGVFGSVCFFLICMKIGKQLKHARRISGDTIFIVGTHFMLVDLFERSMISHGLEETWIYSILAVVYAMILIILYTPVCKFVNNKLPILNGKI